MFETLECILKSLLAVIAALCVMLSHCDNALSTVNKSLFSWSKIKTAPLHTHMWTPGNSYLEMEINKNAVNMLTYFWLHTF